jgi:hydrogenase maturation factor
MSVHSGSVNEVLADLKSEGLKYSAVIGRVKEFEYKFLYLEK